MSERTAQATAIRSRLARAPPQVVLEIGCRLPLHGGASRTALGSAEISPGRATSRVRSGRRSISGGERGRPSRSEHRSGRRVGARSAWIAPGPERTPSVSPPTPRRPLAGLRSPTPPSKAKVIPETEIARSTLTTPRSRQRHRAHSDRRSGGLLHDIPRPTTGAGRSSPAGSPEGSPANLPIEDAGTNGTSWTQTSRTDEAWHGQLDVLIRSPRDRPCQATPVGSRCEPGNLAGLPGSRLSSVGDESNYR